jgi:hypothetical protein
MRCFRHAESEAVATCKFCSKGVCSECVDDTGFGVVCSARCKEEVLSLRAMVERNKRSFSLASRSLTRNGILLALFGVAFFAFSFTGRRDSFLLPFFVVFGAIMFVGAAFSFLNARKWAKTPQP